MRRKKDVFMELVNEAVREYFNMHANKNSIDAERIEVICGELQEMHDELVRNGDSPHEITAVSLQNAINGLRKVAKMLS